MSQLYLHLYHGRKDLNQGMEDWGVDGPSLGPLNYCHVVYADTINMNVAGGTKVELQIRDGCVYYDGEWYGDYEICPIPAPVTNISVPKLTRPDPALTKPPAVNMTYGDLLRKLALMPKEVLDQNVVVITPDDDYLPVDLYKVYLTSETDVLDKHHLVIDTRSHGK